jgi:hypothetical protein
MEGMHFIHTCVLCSTNCDNGEDHVGIHFIHTCVLCSTNCDNGENHGRDAFYTYMCTMLNQL